MGGENVKKQEEGNLFKGDFIVFIFREIVWLKKKCQLVNNCIKI